MLAAGDGVGGLGDLRRELPIEEAEVAVDARGRALMRPSQCTTEGGTGSPEIGKLSTAFFVSPP